MGETEVFALVVLFSALAPRRGDRGERAGLPHPRAGPCAVPDRRGDRLGVFPALGQVCRSSTTSASSRSRWSSSSSTAACTSAGARFRADAPARSPGSAIAGTAVTAAAVAVVAHFLFGFDWQAALLLGAALSPTDPAVVFSVLGRARSRAVRGTILEGESGANDPVGIALLASAARRGDAARAPSLIGRRRVPAADGGRARRRARGRLAARAG